MAYDLNMADPYAGMDDAQVLARAAKALRREAALPPGSIQRIVQGAVFDDAMMELQRRAVRQMLIKLGRGPE